MGEEGEEGDGGNENGFFQNLIWSRNVNERKRERERRLNFDFVNDSKLPSCFCCTLITDIDIFLWRDRRSPSRRRRESWWGRANKMQRRHFFCMRFEWRQHMVPCISSSASLHCLRAVPDSGREMSCRSLIPHARRWCQMRFVGGRFWPGCGVSPFWYGFIDGVSDVGDPPYLLPLPLPLPFSSGLECFLHAGHNRSVVLHLPTMRVARLVVAVWFRVGRVDGWQVRSFPLRDPWSWFLLLMVWFMFGCWVLDLVFGRLCHISFLTPIENDIDPASGDAALTAHPPLWSSSELLCFVSLGFVSFAGFGAASVYRSGCSL